jgi:hypothetical protein
VSCTELSIIYVSLSYFFLEANSKIFLLLISFIQEQCVSPECRDMVQMICSDIIILLMISLLFRRVVEDNVGYWVESYSSVYSIKGELFNIKHNAIHIIILSMWVRLCNTRVWSEEQG